MVFKNFLKFATIAVPVFLNATLLVRIINFYFMKFEALMHPPHLLHQNITEWIL